MSTLNRFGRGGMDMSGCLKESGLALRSIDGLGSLSTG